MGRSGGERGEGEEEREGGRREGRGCLSADSAVSGEFAIPNLQPLIHFCPDVSTACLHFSLPPSSTLSWKRADGVEHLIGPRLCLPYKQTRAWSSALHLATRAGGGGGWGGGAPLTPTLGLVLTSTVSPSLGVCLQGPSRPGDLQSVSLLVAMVTESHSWGCPHPLPSPVQV